MQYYKSLYAAVMLLTTHRSAPGRSRGST